MEVQLDEKISLYIYFLEENPGLAKASNQTSRAGSKHTSPRNVNRRFALNVYCSYEYNWKDKNPITEKEKKERKKTDSFNCYTKMKTNSDYVPEAIVKLTIEMLIS